jgi:hypothetical protein
MTLWMDQTFRTSGKPEVEVEPDGTVEVTWRLPTDPDVSRLTLLIDPDSFSFIGDRCRDLRVLGRLRITTPEAREV